MILRTIIISHLFFFTALTVHTNGTASTFYTTVKTREHEAVFLPCYAGNLGSSSVRWLHEDKLVTDAGDVLFEKYYKIHSNNTLEVLDVTETLSGNYVCQVKRPFPMPPIKQNYFIQVLYPPRVTMIPAQHEVEVELHQDILIHCNAIGLPQPFITWTFNGEEVAEYRNRNTLSFVVTKENSGKYGCIASNGVGNSDVSSITVSAVYPPSISADKIWIHTSPGLRTVIECIVNASPLPKVEWLMNNKSLPKDTRINYYKKGSRYGVIIKSSRNSDIGHYTCVASNKFGVKKLPIEVSALPNIAVFKPVHEKFEHKVTLIWEVESYSPINQYNLLFRQQRFNDKPGNWIKVTIPADNSDGEPIIHTKSYTLTGLEKASYYEACVASKNVYGWSKPSNIYKFSTYGLPDTTDAMTTEERTEESNTITDFLPDYVTDYGNEISESSTISNAKKVTTFPYLGFVSSVLLYFTLKKYS